MKRRVQFLWISLEQSLRCWDMKSMKKNLMKVNIEHSDNVFKEPQNSRSMFIWILFLVMDEFDEDESGEIEFSEFIKLAARFVEPEEDYESLRKELREVFMLYDKEARGYLPLDEFKKILRELDAEVPEDELDEMIGI